MKNIIRLFIVITLTILYSCTQDILENNNEPMKGKEVMGHFELQIAPMVQNNNTIKTRSTIKSTVNETGFVNMWVVQFDKDGNFVKKVYNATVDATAFDAPLVATPTGATSTLYFIANIGDRLATPDNEASFQNQIKSVSSEDNLFTTFGGKKYIPMTGKLVSVVIPYTGFMDKITVTLVRMLARVQVTCKIDPALTRLKISKIRVRNVPIGIQFCASPTATTTPTTTTPVMDYPAENITFTDNTATLVYYLPENQRGIGTNTGANPSERQKGGLANATYIEISGSTTGSDGGDEVGFCLYPGADNFNDYNLVRNGLYEMETTIKEVSASDQRVKVHERSNCYIITPSATTIYIPIKHANDSPELGIQVPDVTDPTLNVGLYWDTSPALFEPSITLGSGLIKVYMWNFREGNGVIVLRNGAGKVLWSWHIWALDDDINHPDNQFIINGLTYMDRNIGAVNPGVYGTTGCAVFSESNGMLYQWGRKDPFLGPEDIDYGLNFNFVAMMFNNDFSNIYANANIGASKLDNDQYLYAVDAKTVGYNNALAYSFQYPYLYIKNWIGTTAKSTVGLEGSESWGGEYGQPKSVYDPCPEGWRVPSYKRINNTLTNFLPSSVSTAISTTPTKQNYASFAASRGNMMLPAIGYRDTNGSLVSSGSVVRVWGATLKQSSSDAYFANITNAPLYTPQDVASRANAHTVRCVKCW